jgi:hypothetical protein
MLVRRAPQLLEPAGQIARGHWGELGAATAALRSNRRGRPGWPDLVCLASWPSFASARPVTARSSAQAARGRTGCSRVPFPRGRRPVRRGQWADHQNRRPFGVGQNEPEGAVTFDGGASWPNTPGHAPPVTPLPITLQCGGHGTHPSRIRRPIVARLLPRTAALRLEQTSTRSPCVPWSSGRGFHARWPEGHPLPGGSIDGGRADGHLFEDSLQVSPPARVEDGPQPSAPRHLVRVGQALMVQVLPDINPIGVGPTRHSCSYS